MRRTLFGSPVTSFTLAPTIVAAIACASGAVSAGGCGSGSGNATSAGDAGGPAEDATADATAGSDGSGVAETGASDAGVDAREGEAGPPAPCSGSGPSPDPWSTYGHDARRTSASNACIHPSITELWRYPAPSTDGGYPGSPLNAIADDTAVYVHLQLSAPTVDKVAAATGTQVWRYQGGADFDNGNWLTLGLGYVMADDDGVYLVDAEDGGLKSTSGVDWWGQTAADTSRFYVVTTTHGDGPGAFVGAWDVAKNLIWTANQQGACMPPIGDENGGLAVDGDSVFFAPRYEVGSPGGILPDGGGFAVPSGLYAFDAATGSKLWSVATSPDSAISAGGGRVYLVEPGPVLAARSEKDGTVAWSTAIAAMALSVSTSPPLLAAGLVIVATSDHVLAFDAATGKAAWSTAVQGAGQHADDQATVNFVSCPSAGQPMATLAPTTLAAATASGTLVVTGTAGLTVLSLASGTLLGSYALSGAIDPVLVGDRVYVLAPGQTGEEVVALQAK